MIQDTPRKEAVRAIMSQIASEAGRKLSTAYIVRMLQRTESGEYFVEYRGQRYDGETVEEVSEENEKSEIC